MMVSKAQNSAQYNNIPPKTDDFHKYKKYRNKGSRVHPTYMYCVWVLQAGMLTGYPTQTHIYQWSQQLDHVVSSDGHKMAWCLKGCFVNICLMPFLCSADIIKHNSCCVFQLTPIEKYALNYLEEFYTSSVTEKPEKTEVSVLCPLLHDGIKYGYELTPALLILLITACCLLINLFVNTYNTIYLS